MRCAVHLHCRALAVQIHVGLSLLLEAEVLAEVSHVGVMCRAYSR